MIILPDFALSVRQPWAGLIVEGKKPVENRTWKTNFRGPVLIHAGKTFDREAYESPDQVPEEYLVCGGIIGMAEIIDCVTEHSSMYFFGPYGFVLRNARPLPFLPYKGRLGFFRVDLPADYIAKAEAFLAETA